MIETIVFRCNTNYEPHARHEWRSGFLWMHKHTCDGVPEHLCTYDCSDPCGAKLYYGQPVNVLRAQAGLPPYMPKAHKHELYFDTWMSYRSVHRYWHCVNPDCPTESRFRVLRGQSYATFEEKVIGSDLWR